MGQLEVIKMIENKKQELSEKLQETSMETGFCEEFCEKYHGTSLDEIAQIDICDLFLVFHLSQSKKISCEELYDFISKNQNLIRYFSNEEKTIELFKELENLMHSEKYDEVQNYFKQNSSLHSIDDVLKIEYFMYILFETKIEKIIGLQSGYDIYSLMEVYKKDGLEIFKTKATMSIINEFQTLLESNNKAKSLVEQSTNKKIDKKRADKIRQSFLSGYNIEGIRETVAQALTYASSVLAKDKKEKRKITKEKASYDKLEIELFRLIQQGEIQKIDKLLDKIEDEEIRLNVLRVVYTHNIEIYKKLQEEHTTLSKSSISSYKVLLSDYGISPEFYNISKITEKSLEEIKMLLEKLSKINITSPMIISAILENSDLETFSYLEGLLEKKIISKDFIIKNQNVFSKESQELINLKSNVNYFQENGMNVHYLRASQEMFLLAPKHLQTSIKVLEEYDFLNFMKTGINCEFLQQTNLKNSIDTLLELGYENNLEESLEILNYSANFSRLRILKELNIPIETTAELINVLSSDKFMIPDDEISTYIYNATNYLMPTVIKKEGSSSSLESLEKYNSSKRTYSFDGILISKNKVKRNISNISEETNEEDRIIYSIVNGSVLSDEEYGAIDNLIRQTSSKVIKKSQANE